MSEIYLLSNAEKKAVEAESLGAFSGLKLSHLKKEIIQILSRIGHDGIFDEYTKHDISHIDYMLKSLDFIIPQETQKILTSSDWLMITLSVYFHDLGMLVTKHEFDNRGQTEFITFKESILSGEFGIDYKDKIINISDESRQDRFIYQELIRKKHAERIKYWILGEQHPEFNIDLSIISELQNLLSHLDMMFKRDLSLICESHHLSDLDDFAKYKVNQQYGTSQDEIVNLHYAALILRTADLLHITSDRTPSTEFRLINPTDPISQEEWAKQQAVKAVRPQSKKNRDGNVDLSIMTDTFEVIAFFKDEKGFFGLVSYLNYVSSQLIENYKFNELAKKQYKVMHEYPWRNIDDSLIEAEKFERKQFEFILDQKKILDLLVGHTLYNDSSVVLRELIQNSLDAIKLKKMELDNDSAYIPSIEINWNEHEKTLMISDTGTGMSLEIIQDHLLKVGSSRYQDINFKKKYPDFYPISRFGIGLLTCFLIADNIDIYTKEENSDSAILLRINKVHGKYLLKYLDKRNIPEQIKKHGTILKLFTRAEVNLTDTIENDLNKWIKFPETKIKLINNDSVIKIGFNTPKEALTQYLKQEGFDVDDKQYKVVELTNDGTVLAIALKYSAYLKEWNFLEISNNDKDNNNKNIPVGFCIEGISIDFNSPGFSGISILAIVNCIGKNAPKTNVARSTIEATHESKHNLEIIYKLYLSQISKEIENLKDNGYSLTWAADEQSWLLDEFVHSYHRPTNRVILNYEIFSEQVEKMNTIIIESNNKREICSISDLREKEGFWNIESVSYNAATSIIKEVKQTEISVLSLIENIYGKNDAKISHITLLLCQHNSNRILDSIIKRYFQITKIKIIPEQRRLDLFWSTYNEPYWLKISSSETNNIYYLQIEDIEIESDTTYDIVDLQHGTFILKNSELHTFLYDLYSKYENQDGFKYVFSYLIQLITDILSSDNGTLSRDKVKTYIERNFIDKSRYVSLVYIWEFIDKESLINLLSGSRFSIYNTSVWYRNNNYWSMFL
jgi:hypothetical protein